MLTTSKKGLEVVHSKRKGVSSIAVVVILIVAVAAAGVTAFYASTPASGSNSCNAVKNSQSSGSASGVHISLYSEAANPSNAPGYLPDRIVLLIGVNNTVTWTNDDSAAHTATSTSAPSCASFDSGNLNSGATYTHTFTAPGTYRYACRYHGWMTATIVVEAPR